MSTDGIIDLGKFKAREKHQHRWAIVTTFAVDEATIKMLADNQKKLNDGGDPEAQMHVNIEMTQDRIVNIEGPGCVKCHLHWKQGHGELCDVSDDDRPS